MSIGAPDSTDIPGFYDVVVTVGSTTTGAARRSTYTAAIVAREREV